MTIAIQDPLREGMVLLCELLGRHTTVAELGEGVVLQGGRLSQEQAVYALRRVHVQARWVSMSVQDLGAYLLPALLLLKDGQLVILTKLEAQQVELLLPAVGHAQTAMSLDMLKACYAGQALLAKLQYRDDGRAGQYAQTEDVHWFWGALQQCKAAYAEVAVAALVANVLAIASAIFVMQVYDRVVPNSAIDTLWILASGVILAIVFEAVLRYVRSQILHGLGKRLDLQLSTRLFERVLSLRLDAKPASLGTFSTQVREFESVREFMTASSAALMSDIPFTLFFLAIVFTLGGQIVLVPALAIVLIVLPGLWLQARLAQMTRQGLKESAIKNSVLLEAFEYLETLKACRAEARALRQWESLSAQLVVTAHQTQRVVALLSYWASMVQQLGYVAVVIFGVYLIQAGQMTVGSLVACSILSARALGPMTQIASMLARWQHTKVALQGLDQLMQAPVERPSHRVFVHRDGLRGEFHLEGVGQKYEALGYALRDVTLHIRPGEHIAILGSNGAGKSTLLRLLAGWVDPTEGRILLDNTHIAQIDPSDRRNALGYLPQDIAIFYGSLRDNLDPQGVAVHDETIFQALDAVGLGDFVRSHPLGLDLGLAGNHSVSGGQRQAIGLARLILQEPRIVILDEPTAILDQASENQVVAYFQTWLAQRTLVVATHKKNVLDLVERAVVLRQGRVVSDAPIQRIVSGNHVYIPPVQD